MSDGNRVVDVSAGGREGGGVCWRRTEGVLGERGCVGAGAAEPLRPVRPWPDQS